MRALADRLTIDSSPLGTTVCLRFEHFHAIRREDADSKVG
jgi:hypothetical protein